MGKSYRAIAKEKYEAFEAEWLKTHDEDVVCADYFLDVNLKVNELPKSRNGKPIFLHIEDASNYYIASLLAGAVYSRNEGTGFYLDYLDDLYKVLPKDKVDKYVYGDFESEGDYEAINWKYNELEFVDKFREESMVTSLKQSKRDKSPKQVERE